jgi:hypothetical protein
VHSNWRCVPTLITSCDAHIHNRCTPYLGALNHVNQIWHTYCRQPQQSFINFISIYSVYNVCVCFSLADHSWTFKYMTLNPKIKCIYILNLWDSKIYHISKWLLGALSLVRSKFFAEDVQCGWEIPRYSLLIHTVTSFTTHNRIFTEMLPHIRRIRARVM